MKIRSLTSKLIFRSICLFLSFFVLFSINIPSKKIIAQTYDIVIETEFEEETVKIIEINYSQDIVNFYCFDVNGFPEYENGEQVNFFPGDENYENYVSNLAKALIINSITILSIQEFSFQLYFQDISDWEMVSQICYDGESITNIRFFEHHELDEPFDLNSVIGDFSVIYSNEISYTGYKYVSDSLGEEWDRSNISGSTSNSIFASLATYATGSIVGRIRFKLTGTTSTGRKIKIEDKGDGKGPQVYEDKNGDGDYDDEGEHITDPDDIEEIMDEVSDDLENGLGEYEGEAWDDNGTPNDPSDDKKIDAIIWIKNSDGSFSGIKITRNESGGWDLDGANRVSAQWMADNGYIPHGTDPNMRGTWFVGGREDSNGYYVFEKFGRFSRKEQDKNGDGDCDDPGERWWEPDPEGEDPDSEQRPYCYCGFTSLTTPFSYDPISATGKHVVHWFVKTVGADWP